MNFDGQCPLQKTVISSIYNNYRNKNGRTIFIAYPSVQNILLLKKYILAG
ncbi:hypothetical protein PCC6912_57470 [Chlorogloeopsis fritschii PCC 6912]|uniref:Uncharacterized protein n=1 Tax=Chlorogloeopsis fritschii PCC 6912 TaxID=211165 RepID=A0A433MYN5_CHLFR|nr:hypothetical protein PCC6912_57470 [Chlorogloeopsis fritschii PCC 6912]